MTNELARAAAIDVLASEQIGEIDFYWGERHVTPRHYERVLEAIGHEHILVTYDETVIPSSYYSDLDTMCFGFTTAESTPRRAMVVHESTHAICDLRHWDMTVADSEGMAYLAQCIYGRALTEHPEEVRLESAAGGIRDDVFDLAWDMAGRVLDFGVRHFYDDEDQLRFLIEGHPWYEETAAEMAGYHGSRRAQAQQLFARMEEDQASRTLPGTAPYRRPTIGR
jgi:hypothetical protein